LRWSVFPGITRSKIMMTELGMGEVPLVAGQDNAIEGTTLVPMGLKPGTRYLFRVVAGNSFEFENVGARINVETLPRRKGKNIYFLAETFLLIAEIVFFFFLFSFFFLNFFLQK